MASVVVTSAGRVKLIAGSILLGVLCVVFVVGPILVGVGPNEQDLLRAGSSPSVRAPFGTDELGRDLFVRLCHGGRGSLATALAAGLTALVIGSGIGALAGFVRRVDGTVVQSIDLLVSVSNWTFVLVVAPWFLRLPGGIGILSGLLASDRLARLVRSHVQGNSFGDVISAAIVSGSTKISLVRRHLWPHLSGLVAVEVLFVMALSSSFEASLGFLQFGDQLSLGLALQDAKGSVTNGTFRLAIPALLLVSILLSFYLISRGVSQVRPNGLGRDQRAPARA